MVSQIDKLAKDIEDFLDDYDGQLIQKQPIGEEDFKKLQNELVKKLCFYIGERVKTAVEAERKKLTNENNIIAEWIVSEKETFGGIKYFHLGKIFSTDKFVKIQFMDSKYIEVMTLLHFGEKYKICETLRGEKP